MRTKHAVRVAMVGLVTLLLGCGQNPPTASPLPAPSLPEITAETEEGFVDLVFAITESQTGADGSATFHAQGKHRGKTVGLRVELGGGWQSSSLGEGLVVHAGKVSFESTGGESDELAKALGELYAGAVRPGAMRPGKIVFSAVALEGNPQQLDAGPVRIKLFVDSEDDARYAELFTNIDVKRGRVEIREKDAEYRDPVLRALGAE